MGFRLIILLGILAMFSSACKEEDNRKYYYEVGAEFNAWFDSATVLRNVTSFSNKGRSEQLYVELNNTYDDESWHDDNKNYMYFYGEKELLYNSKAYKYNFSLKMIREKDSMTYLYIVPDRRFEKNESYRTFYFRVNLSNRQSDNTCVLWYYYDAGNGQKHKVSKSSTYTQASRLTIRDKEYSDVMICTFEKSESYYEDPDIVPTLNKIWISPTHGVIQFLDKNNELWSVHYG